MEVKLMKKSLLIVGLCTAASLLAQGLPAGGGRMGPGGPGGRGRGMQSGLMRTVTGAPYSAVEVTETQQVLTNGNTIQHRSQSNVYRDSLGRVRTESTMDARGQANPQTARTIVNIHDPVAGVRRTLDPQNKTANEMAIRPMGRGGNGGPPAGRLMLGRGGNPNAAARGVNPRTDPNTVTENLPMQTINGLQATGVRVTRTIPAGQIGNAHPIQIVHENWMAVELQI